MEKALQYAEKLSELIKIQTISKKDGKSPAMDAFHEKIKDLFPNILKVAKLEFEFSCAILKWSGKDSSHKVLFMNHFDVVPAKGNWTHKPFDGEIADGKLWGRGTLDTKGGLFCMLQAADELAKEGFVPKYDIWFESSCCEEITTSNTGADLIAQKWSEDGIRFDFVLDEGGMIIPEPMGGVKGLFAMIGVGEKGTANLKFTALSNGGHASTPSKDSPLARLGKFMAYVDDHNPLIPKLSDPVVEMLKCLSNGAQGPLGFVLKHPRLFTPVLKAVMLKNGTSNALLRTTMAFTCAQGSEANNVIPQSAYVVGNMRYSHHEGAQHSAESVTKIAKRYGIETEIMDSGFPSVLSSFNTDAFKLISQAVNNSFKDVIPTPYIQTGASDSRFMSRVSDNIYHFVPFIISKEQLASVHGINESVDICTLAPAVDFYRFMMQNL